MTDPARPAPRTEPCRKRIRVAFYGKCGTATNDAPLSLVRQLDAVVSALPEHAPLTAYFADIGVWNRGDREHAVDATVGADPADGPAIDSGDDVPHVVAVSGHRVNGGLVELLAQAHDPARCFDVVACVDGSRLPRRMPERRRVLHELAECGVRVVLLDEATWQHYLGPDAVRPQVWSPGALDWTTCFATILDHPILDHPILDHPTLDHRVSDRITDAGGVR